MIKNRSDLGNTKQTNIPKLHDYWSKKTNRKLRLIIDLRVEHAAKNPKVHSPVNITNPNIRPVT